MRILVAGGKGQLGQCLQKVSIDYPWLTFKFVDSKECDVLDMASINKHISDFQPDFIINCSAYTAVDLAESNQQDAYNINCVGASNLALACKENNLTLIHISTDFVFSGMESKLLSEEDATEPLSVYGSTKLAGEAAVSSQLERHIIIRTSWLYSEFGNNFLKTMMRLGADREEINVVNDQIGSPTYAIDLANAILSIIGSEKTYYGVFHYSNEGAGSWYDFAFMIFNLSGTKIKVNAIGTSAYPTPAKRPSFSILDKRKIKSLYNVEIPHWADGLQRCLNVKCDYKIK